MIELRVLAVVGLLVVWAFTIAAVMAAFALARWARRAYQRAAARRAGAHGHVTPEAPIIGPAAAMCPANGRSPLGTRSEPLAKSGPPTWRL